MLIDFWTEASRLNKKGHMTPWRECGVWCLEAWGVVPCLPLASCGRPLSKPHHLKVHFSFTSMGVWWDALLSARHAPDMELSDPCPPPRGWLIPLAWPCPSPGLLYPPDVPSSFWELPAFWELSCTWVYLKAKWSSEAVWSSLRSLWLWLRPIWQQAQVHFWVEGRGGAGWWL